MNSKLYMAGLVALSIWGIKSLKESKINLKSKKLFRFTYIMIIIGTLGYFLGYEVGKMVSHMSH